MLELVLVPTLPTSNDYNPNPHIAGLGNSLYQTECLLRNEYTFANFVDQDEFIIPQTTLNLVDWLDAELKNSPKIGVFNIKHSGIYFDPKVMPHFQLENPLSGKGQGAKIKVTKFDWKTLDFKWLTSAKSKPDIHFNGKPIVVIGRAEQPSTHWVDVVFYPFEKKDVGGFNPIAGYIPKWHPGPNWNPSPKWCLKCPLGLGAILDLATILVHSTEWFLKVA